MTHTFTYTHSASQTCWQEWPRLFLKTVSCLWTSDPQRRHCHLQIHMAAPCPVKMYSLCLMKTHCLKHFKSKCSRDKEKFQVIYFCLVSIQFWWRHMYLSFLSYILQHSSNVSAVRKYSDIKFKEEVCSRSVFHSRAYLFIVVSIVMMLVCCVPHSSPCSWGEDSERMEKKGQESIYRRQAIWSPHSWWEVQKGKEEEEEEEELQWLQRVYLYTW